MDYRRCERRGNHIRRANVLVAWFRGPLANGANMGVAVRRVSDEPTLSRFLSRAAIRGEEDCKCSNVGWRATANEDAAAPLHQFVVRIVARVEVRFRGRSSDRTVGQGRYR